MEEFIDLSLIFNESGWIIKNKCWNYMNDDDVTHIVLYQSCDQKISIGNGFLCNYSNLTHVEIREKNKITSINSDFCRHCSKLISIDLSGLQHLTYIGDKFAFYCTSLLQINMSGLINLKYIYKSFASQSKNKKVIVDRFTNKILCESLAKMNFDVTEHCDRPIIYLTNECII